MRPPATVEYPRSRNGEPQKNPANLMFAGSNPPSVTLSASPPESGIYQDKFPLFLLPGDPFDRVALSPVLPARAIPHPTARTLDAAVAEDHPHGTAHQDQREDHKNSQEQIHRTPLDQNINQSRRNEPSPLPPRVRRACCAPPRASGEARRDNTRYPRAPDDRSGNCPAPPGG